MSKYPDFREHPASGDAQNARFQEECRSAPTFKPGDRVTVLETRREGREPVIRDHAGIVAADPRPEGLRTGSMIPVEVHLFAIDPSASRELTGVRFYRPESLRLEDGLRDDVNEAADRYVAMLAHLDSVRDRAAELAAALRGSGALERLDSDDVKDLLDSARFIVPMLEQVYQFVSDREG